MRRKREINVFSIAFLDLLSGALGAVIILYISIPKNSPPAKDEPAQVKFETSKESPDLRSSIRKILTLEEVLEDKKKTIQELEATVEKLQEKNRKIAALSQDKGHRDIDVGFKFKGKRIVFIIDVSGSMRNEDRIGQVKAGLKMLITSMDHSFHIDVVHFPNGIQGHYRSKWGSLKQMGNQNKDQVYQFLHSLRPFGATPTRSVMRYALRNYPSATDIVLLSDGAPTRPNTKQRDDIGSVIRDIASQNTKEVQINTVGVGSNFLTNTQNDKYIFLKRLSELHNGFFVGF
ncbi:MAG: VWA domain-containing protein [Bacteriovoracaceae bacterium]